MTVRAPLLAGGVLDGGRFVSYETLRSDPFRLTEGCPPGARIALRSDDALAVLGALLTLDGRVDEVWLLPAALPPTGDEGLTRLIGELGLGQATRHEWGGVGIDRWVGPSTGSGAGATVLAPVAAPAPAPAETSWVVLTSGTTGTPKPVRHTLRSLSRAVHRSVGPLVWGLAFDPNRMAGLQLLLQASYTEAGLVTAPLTDPLGARVQRWRDGGVDALSATPSLWRRILQLPDLQAWPLRRITLGGEIADQRLLDALHARFEGARVTHVFASTESGTAFSVGDGRAGFPARYLSEPPRGIRLEIRDGVLHVANTASSAAGADGFVSTGDVVEVSGDRVLFRGRASGVVNVGGAMVWPEQVEALLRTHPDVVDAVVTATPNPLAGNLLLASVVPAAGVDGAALRGGLRAWVRARASAAHVPARVSVVERVEHPVTGKAQR